MKIVTATGIEQEVGDFVTEFTMKRVLRRSKAMDDALLRLLQVKAPRTHRWLQLLPFNATSRILGLEIRARVTRKQQGLYKVYRRGKYLGEFTVNSSHKRPSY